MENMQTYKFLEFLVILLSSCIVMVSVITPGISCELSGVFASFTPYHNSLNNDSSTLV